MIFFLKKKTWDVHFIMVWCWNTNNILKKKIQNYTHTSVKQTSYISMNNWSFKCAMQVHQCSSKRDDNSVRVFARNKVWRSYKFIFKSFFLKKRSFQIDLTIDYLPKSIPKLYACTIHYTNELDLILATNDVKYSEQCFDERASKPKALRFECHQQQKQEQCCQDDRFLQQKNILFFVVFV